MGPKFHTLVARGELGLICDDEGMALGPVDLVTAVQAGGDDALYRTAPVSFVQNALAST